MLHEKEIKIRQQIIALNEDGLFNSWIISSTSPDNPLFNVWSTDLRIIKKEAIKIIPNYYSGLFDVELTLKENPSAVQGYDGPKKSIGRSQAEILAVPKTFFEKTCSDSNIISMVGASPDYLPKGRRTRDELLNLVLDQRLTIVENYLEIKYLEKLLQTK